MQTRLHLYFKGHVQGVGFRFTAESIASGLGIRGWVKNLSSGKVEIIAEAEKEILSQFLESIEDNFSGYIVERDLSWQVATGEFQDFNICL